MAAGIALLGIVTFWAMHIAFTRQLDVLINEEAQSLILEYQTDGPAELARAIGQRERLDPGARVYYAVFDANGRRTIGAFQAERPALGVHDIAFIDPTEGPDAARGVAVDLPDGRRLVVAADREWIENIDHVVLATFAAAFAAVLLLGMVGALSLGSYLRNRLHSIQTTAAAIIGGDISRRMPMGAGDDEFDKLAGLLNTMLEEIERLLENVRQVSGDIAHDLRTPLTRLRNALEQGLSGRSSELEMNATVSDAIKRVDDILAMFAAILRISEIESGSIRRRFEPFDATALVTDLAESYAPAVRDSGRDLDWSIEQGITLEGDRELVAQAITNLIDNAQNHSPTGTHISIGLARRAASACITVADNGPGVSEADRALIARRFIRLDASRSRPGHGLGLNMVDAIARLHRGTLSFADNNPGLIAELVLPAAPAAED
ncbi:HAMP domain-containing histidine kinase [Sphingomonas sp. RB56-2]|uniref:histidine kinase n=1 Tax=Sphingomonas brevis TaxID=2908206 RepID=A0ABT0SA10_9SPHN|nr:HAMP domain-containing sensor histidine kinase [Sphingomonas brevis]MCL6740969.1 HAMP domain-containing histidine kinase [Sphingomonas brevis]